MDRMLSKLKILQEIYRQKFKLEIELKEIPRNLEERKETIARMKQKYLDIGNRIEKEQSLETKVKFDLEEAQKNREESEAKVEHIKTQREYEAWEKEIKEFVDTEARHRKNIQSILARQEELKIEFSTWDETISKEEEELAVQSSEIAQILKEKQEACDSFAEEEKELVEELGEEICFKFQRIIKNKDQGIVSISGNICNGCHMYLPLEFANQVRSNKDFQFCPNCRIVIKSVIRFLMYSFIRDPCRLWDVQSAAQPLISHLPCPLLPSQVSSLLKFSPGGAV